MLNAAYLWLDGWISILQIAWKCLFIAFWYCSKRLFFVPVSFANLILANEFGIQIWIWFLETFSQEFVYSWTGFILGCVCNSKSLEKKEPELCNCKMISMGLLCAFRQPFMKNDMLKWDEMETNHFELSWYVGKSSNRYQLRHSSDSICRITHLLIDIDSGKEPLLNIFSAKRYQNTYEMANHWLFLHV